MVGSGNLRPTSEENSTVLQYMYSTVYDDDDGLYETRPYQGDAWGKIFFLPH